jgi:hypothetical protein
VRAVGPGEEIITPLHMNAPAVPGKYTLEVDIVHENVRWFDCACRIPLVVGEPDPLPPSEPRLKPTPLSRLKRPRVVRIPTTLHRIGLGPGTALERRRGTSEWTTRVWTDIDLAELNIGEAELARARDVEELSFLARYEILARHGGVFVDVDLDPPEAALLRGIDAFAVLEGPGVVGAALLGAVPNHHVFVRAARLARQALGRGAKSPRHWGPYLLNLIIEQDGGVAIFDSAAKPPR